MPNPAAEVAIAKGLVESLEPLGRSIDAAAKMLEGVWDKGAKLARAGSSTAETTSGTSIASRHQAFADFNRQLEDNGQSEPDILSSIRPSNLIGKGEDHAVYKIDNVVGFLLRTKLRGSGVSSSEGLRAVADVWPERNIGQSIARLGDSEIVKEVSGEPLGFNASHPLPGLLLHKLELTASMPQRAYNDFARTLMELPKRRLAFDSNNANNVLADAQSASFNLVDIASNSEFEPSSISLLRPLTWTHWVARSSNHTLPDRLLRTVLERSMDAFETTGLPFVRDSSTRQLFKHVGMVEDYLDNSVEITAPQRGV